MEEFEIVKIKKGDFFKKGTSDTLYLALSNETVRGWVRCKAPYVEMSRVMRFNSTFEDLTIVPNPEQEQS